MNKPTWTTGQLTQLRFQIATYFNSEDQRDLCFELAIDYDDLPSQTNSGKARELVMRLYREGRLLELIELCTKLRPKIIWRELAENEPTIEKIADIKARALRVFLKNLIDDGRIRAIALKESLWLIKFLAEKLSKDHTTNVIRPAILRWRSGEIESVNSLKRTIELGSEKWLATIQKNNELLPLVNKWLAGLSVEIEKLTAPICQEFDIPEKTLHIRFPLDIDDIFLVDSTVYADYLTGINDMILVSFLLISFGGPLAVLAKPTKVTGELMMMIVFAGLLVLIASERLKYKIGEFSLPKLMRRGLTDQNLEQRLFYIQTKLQGKYESSLNQKIDQDTLIDSVVNRAEKELMKIVDTIKFA